MESKHYAIVACVAIIALVLTLAIDNGVSYLEMQNECNECDEPPFGECHLDYASVLDDGSARLIFVCQQE